MQRREVVLRAIQRTGPPYVPIYFVNQDKDQSDLVLMDVQFHFLGEKRDRSEWGFLWERFDETMGQPKTSVLTNWEEDLPNLVVPDPHDPARLAAAPAFAARYADRYRMAGFGLSGFTAMWCLRGFEQLMADIALAPERVRELADIVFGFEEAVMRTLPAAGFDAVAFFDDWGAQERMLISPGLWCTLFKPYYRRQFALAHELGLHVYFHCCGQIMPIIPDLIEVGVDILNISQPNLYDIAELGRRFGGQVCFICPVSYQTTSIQGTRDEIFAAVRQLVDHLGCFHGGLIGYVEQYHSIGLSDANYAACVEAFRTLGVYAPQPTEG